MGAGRLLGVVWGHWRVGNSLHSVREVALGENACRVRSGAAPQVLAALRDPVVYLLAQIDAGSHPEALEWLQIHPNEVRKLTGVPQNE